MAGDWSEALRALDREAVPAFAARVWGARPESVREVGRGVHAVFRFEPAGGRESPERAGYLRLGAAALRPRDEVEAALDYQRHAAAAGAPVCAPLASRAGRFVEVFESAAGDFLATAVAEVPGRCVESLAPDAAVYRAWGRSLAALHAAAASFRPAPGRRYLTWESIWADVAARVAGAERDDAEARDCFRELDAWMRALPREPDARGLLHADVRAGNAFFDGERVHLIDFDEPVRGFWAADVARPFLERAGGDRDETRALVAALVAGYRELRRFDARWERELGRFVRAKALEAYTWMRDCWSGDAAPGGEPRAEALRRLRAAFHRPSPW